MRIPVYNENYRYLNSRGGGRLQGVNAGHNQANESLAMAGRNMQGLGNSLMQASNQVFETDDFVAKAKAENAINEMQKSFMAKQTEMEKLKGENALNVSQDFEKWRNEQVQALQKSLDGNERALAYFNMGADEKYAGQKRWVDSYQAQEQETYLDSTFQATLDTAHDDFLHNINNPELMNEAKMRGFGAIQEYVRRKGLGDNVAKQLYKDWISKNFIQGTQLFIDEGNLGRARVLLNYGKDYLGADEAAALKKNIQTAQELQNARYLQNQEKARLKQFNDSVNGIVKTGYGLLYENIDTISEEQALTMAYEYAYANANGNLEVAEKAYDIFSQKLKNVYAIKENAETAFEQSLTQKTEMDIYEKKAQIDELEKQGKISADKATYYRNILFSPYANITDNTQFISVCDAIQNGSMKNITELNTVIKQGKFTEKDANTLRKLLEDKQKPELEAYNQNFKEVCKSMSSITTSSMSATRKIEINQKNAQIISFLQNEVEIFKARENRYPSLQELNAMGYSIVKRQVIIKQTNGDEVKFIDDIENKQKQYKDETGNDLYTDKMFAEARQTLSDYDLPITHENEYRLIHAEDTQKEIEQITIDNNIRQRGYETKYTDKFKPAERGNIDPTNRPTVEMENGETATVKTMSFQGQDGLETVIPTVRDDGYVMTEEEAIKHYYNTGKHFGKFKTVKEAVDFAQALHLDQQKYYLGVDEGDPQEDDFPYVVWEDQYMS